MTPMTNPLPLPAQGAGKAGAEPRGETMSVGPDQPGGRIEGGGSPAGDFAKVMAQRDPGLGENASAGEADGDASGQAGPGREAEQAVDAYTVAQSGAEDSRASVKEVPGRVQGGSTEDKPEQVAIARSSPRREKAGGDAPTPTGQPEQARDPALQRGVMHADVRQMKDPVPLVGGLEVPVAMRSAPLRDGVQHPLARSWGERFDVPGRLAAKTAEAFSASNPNGAAQQEQDTGHPGNGRQRVDAPEGLADPRVQELLRRVPSGEMKTMGATGQTGNQAQTIEQPALMQPRASMFDAQITSGQPGLAAGSVRMKGEPVADRFVALDTALSALAADTSQRQSSPAQQVQTALPEPKTLAIVRDALVEMNAKAQREIEIQLSPRELGKLRFVMAPSEGQISVQITADRPEVLEALRRHAENFAQDLGSEGFGHAEFEFIHRDDDSDASRNDAFEGQSGADNVEPDRHERRWQIASGRLDVRV